MSNATNAMTDKQRTMLANLQAKVLGTSDDFAEYHERMVDRFGEDAWMTVEGEPVWRPKFLASRGDEISRATASACIDILKAMDLPRCPGYCGERGVRHSTVRYYDDHYDYECGLS